MIPGIVASSGNQSPWTPLASTTSITSGGYLLSIVDGVIRVVTSYTSGSSYMESRDNGASFTTFSPSFPSTFSQYAVSSGFVVAVGTSGLRIRRRVNDASSAFQTITPEPFLNELPGGGPVYNGTRFAFVTSGNGIAVKVYSSDTGASGTWVQRTVPSLPPSDTVFLNQMYYALGTMMAIGLYNSGAVYYALVSTDGISWQTITLPTMTGRPTMGSTDTLLVLSSVSGTDAYTSVPGSNTFTPVTLGVPASDIRQYGSKLYGFANGGRSLVVGDSLETLQVMPGPVPGNRSLTSLALNSTSNELWVTSGSLISGGIIWKRPIPA